MIDSHIHLDQYDDDEINDILKQPLNGLVCVSMNMKSLERMWELRRRDSHIHVCAGFHPEQEIDMNQVQSLLNFIDTHHKDLTAIGEVGLPQYLRREHTVDEASYERVLELFIQSAAQYNLPVVLHAVYDDVLTALKLLKKYEIKRAHFHWFKGSEMTLQEVLASSYMVSVTPDILWNEKTRRVVDLFPIDRLMIETDGPYPAEGFNRVEITAQLNAIINEISIIKHVSADDVRQIIQTNTERFYQIS